MHNLTEVLACITSQYPKPSDLSNARLTKLVYLSDWHHVLMHGVPISSINWYFDNYGPFVWDIKEAVVANPSLFEMVQTRNVFGSDKTEIHFRCDASPCRLSESAMASITFVIEKTKSLSWSDFIRLVYSTYPVSSSPRYTFLNLTEKAREYKSSRKG